MKVLADTIDQKKQRLLILVVFLSLISPLTSLADQGYSDGLKAYFDREYKQAQAFWLSSAKTGNARSMFNLGLLHEQGKIKGADQTKALEWFELASKAGYPGASYHLAKKLLADGSDSQRVDALMQLAASQNYAPANIYLNGDSFELDISPEPVNSSEPKKTNNSLAVSSLVSSSQNTSSDQGNGVADISKKFSDRPKQYLSENWILSKKSNYWTIQLLAFSEEAKVHRFIIENKLEDKAAYFFEQTNTKPLYKLIYGAYKTKVQADFARQNLNKDLQSHGPWLRTVESVQTLIKSQ